MNNNTDNRNGLSDEQVRQVLGNEKEGINFPSAGADRNIETEIYNNNANVEAIRNSADFSDSKPNTTTPVEIPKNSDIDFPNSDQPQAKVTSLTDTIYSDNNFDFPNGSVSQQKAPSPIMRGQTSSDFEFPSETLRKEELERERQMPVTEAENKTMKKSFWQKIKDFFSGNKKKKGL